MWELSLHTPDVLASAYLVWGYLRGYQLTGDAAHLKEARRWALSGLPFVYQWSRYPVMMYATTPVFGATNWRAPNWIGRPVQWCRLRSRWCRRRCRRRPGRGRRRRWPE